MKLSLISSGNSCTSNPQAENVANDSRLKANVTFFAQQPKAMIKNIPFKNGKKHHKWRVRVARGICLPTLLDERL